MIDMIAVCGGRDFKDRGFIFKTLEDIYFNSPFNGILNGGCSGVDSIASDWAIENGVFPITIPALWKVYGKRAGPMRNSYMSNFPIRQMIAFPGGRGTDNMINICKMKGIDFVKLSNTGR